MVGLPVVVLPAVRMPWLEMELVNHTQHLSESLEEFCGVRCEAVGGCKFDVAGGSE